YRRDLDEYVLPPLGALKLSDVRRGHVQSVVDKLVSEGKSASKVRNAIMPLRLIVRRALERDEITVNPCANVRLPGLGEGRTRAADPGELTDLLGVLPEDVRPIYATAGYAGLRRGELRGLRW